ncbi:SNF2 family helicase-like protein [Plenodomus tracheiphilus IPT5]|uniref:SNF2 family helicase-like protein n=1 Tax=Plenodomus tracheiphilus IPT5 TaxID=1408161 RepID=A0A6A7AZ96_9PLEO|nr:SNF2 family helicase-like protein [Plenodomus tracheiphilus IPT5]
MTPIRNPSTHGAESVRDDLQEYIAVGCLHFDQTIPSPCSSVNSEKWLELLHHDLPHEVRLIIGEEAERLLSARWIRLFLQASKPVNQHSLVRVYLLPADWHRRTIDRSSRNLKAALRQLLQQVDTSSESWTGSPTGSAGSRFDPWAKAEPHSLYYLFNNLPSPNPEPENVKNRYARAAMDDLLRSSADSPWEMHGEQPLPGLRTRLYPYQARSASLMVQRETSPQQQLDPRLEARLSPDGQRFYFGARDGSFLRTPKYYETNRGGILAETMGLGKTIICLAVILATKGHYPRIPPAYHPPPPVRSRVGKLSDMAASMAGRFSIPASAYLDQSEANGNGIPPTLRDALQRNPVFYEIPSALPRKSRHTSTPPQRQLLMCSGTIIVVPRNLLHQWQSEIQKHVLKGGLKVLVVDTASKGRSRIRVNSQSDGDIDLKSELPVTTELMKYDVVLFSRNRFEQEIQDGADSQGRRATSGAALTCSCSYIGATRIRSCTCFNNTNVYESLLLKLHWLRIIVDEGHSFSSSVSNAVLVAKQIPAERRWVVSGTPARNLVGVEMDALTLDTESDELRPLRASVIEHRKAFIYDDETSKATKALGSLASHFLMVQPWSESKDWDEYVYRHEHQQRKTYSSFSSCFVRVLENLVVKTQPEDVDKSIVLPPMRHRVVYLKPCWFDKMTANLFVQVLRANAITSERTDVDYLFHKNSAKARHSLIRNLRQSNFTWTGFSLADVIGTLETSENYLAKEGKRCSQEDENLLRESSQMVSRLATSKSWKALSQAHEVGMAINSWPAESEESFALTYPAKPAMIGIAQLLEGQTHVDSNMLAHDPVNGLASVGQAAKAKIAAMASLAKSEDASSDPELHEDGAIMPFSERQPPEVSHKATPNTTTTSSRKPNVPAPSSEAQIATTLVSPVRSRKRKMTTADATAALAADSPLVDTKIIGTTSAKLTYLLDKVVEHQGEEKIIIFYDGDNAAYYIAQGLELLHINHRIYARTLENVKRSEYVRQFNEESTVRVLLIDVACGALGLNLNIASVVLIVNPINRPFLEAQAIKRAHRIGQTREVLVETLVLENTIEHAIFDRAKRMSRADHEIAKELEDDASVIEIIQNAQILQVISDEENGIAAFAPLKTPQQVFGRPNRHKFHRSGLADSKPTERLSKRSKARIGASVPRNPEEGECPQGGESVSCLLENSVHSDSLDEASPCDQIPSLSSNV